MLAVRRRTAGFTLIELMIVVAIVGVLAALAIYGVRKYMLNAKTAEAKNAVGQMAKDAKTAYERESMASTLLQSGSSAARSSNLCVTGVARPSIPTSITPVRGSKYQSAPNEWSMDAGTAGMGFPCLKFSLSDPQYYMYGYTGTSGSAGTFSASANGDLDGNGTTSTFAIQGAVTSGTVFVSPTFLEVNGEE
jgi:type IV pilus assembly protein PilA